MVTVLPGFAELCEHSNILRLGAQYLPLEVPWRLPTVLLSLQLLYFVDLRDTIKPWAVVKDREALRAPRELILDTLPSLVEWEAETGLARPVAVAILAQQCFDKNVELVNSIHPDNAFMHPQSSDLLN